MRLARTLERLPDDTYVELVSGVFDTRIPSTIMSLLFLGTGLVVAHCGAGPIVTLLVLAGGVASVLRLAVIFGDGARIGAIRTCVDAVEAVETRFAAVYLLFAAILGAFGAMAVSQAGPQMDMLVAILLVGYAAGVAAGVAARPWIAIPSIVMAVMPTACVTALRGDMVDAAAAVSLVALMIGGIGSLMQRYRTDARLITARRTFSELARHDHLTGLANRLALAERFADVAAAATAQSGIAVHCLDLDGFKEINDRLGHPVGDAVLIAVAGRLRGFARNGDFAVRLGGDEFVYVQTGVRHTGEIEATAIGLSNALREPFAYAGGTVHVGATVGHSAIATDRDADLEAMMLAADRMLIGRKTREKREPASETAPSRLRLVR